MLWGETDKMYKDILYDLAKDYEDGRMMWEREFRKSLRYAWERNIEGFEGSPQLEPQLDALRSFISGYSVVKSRRPIIEKEPEAPSEEAMSLFLGLQE